jgi:hypothetical protein
MRPPNDQFDVNRRLSRRRPAKSGITVVCHANSLGLGPNIGLALFDVSEGGARLTVKVPLEPRQEIAIDLCSVGHRKSVKSLAEVVWCAPVQDQDTFHVGLKFPRYLAYQDLQNLGRAN